MQFYKKLETAGFENINISINVSVIELLRDEFIDALKTLIKNAEINAKNLGIEVTESIIMDNFEIINEKLYKLREMGIRFRLMISEQDILHYPVKANLMCAI